MGKLQIKDKNTADRIHIMMTAYNGLVVMLAAIFMGVTQSHIGISGMARDFLYNLPGLPTSPEEMFLGTISSFTVLVCCGYVYSNVSRLPDRFRYCVFLMEIGACIFLLHSLRLSYDGVVLLLLADFMYCYQGEGQLKIMLLMMGAIYGLLTYSMSVLRADIISMDMYMTYYSTDMQSFILAVKNLAVYGNMMLFVVFMATLLKDVSKEKREIADLNYRMIKTNELLKESNVQLNESNAKLNKANRKLWEYAMTIASLTEEKERNRLARELHDTLGHALTGMVTGLDACMLIMDCAPEVAKKQLAKIQETAKNGIKDIRRSMQRLRPENLAKYSFREALEKLVADFSAVTSVEAVLEIDNLPSDIAKEQQEAIYRIVQEGLTNASRHGKADRVKIFILGTHDRLNIILSDNGRGCSQIKAGYGLRHMQERLELLGGTLKYWSEKGFVLEANLPIHMEVSDQ